MTFAEILAESGVPFATEGSGTRSGWIQFDCPFCVRHLYMGFNTEGNYINCWKCGKRDLVETLVELTKLSFHACRELIRGIPNVVRKPKPKGRLILPNAGPLLPAHKKYLRERGFNPSKVSRLWEVQGIGINARLAWRLLIPIQYRGRVVSWTTRSIGASASLRYVSAKPVEEEVSHKTLLYGEDYCRHGVIVTEGPFDAWRIGPGAVATFGTGFSRAQVLKISRYPVRVICFDAEAESKARELASMLEIFPGETYVVTLDSKDPGEATERELKALRRFLR